jgi:hypothetical protein
MSDDHCVEKLRKQPNFYAREGQIKFGFYTNKSMILLVYKEAYFNANSHHDYVVPSVTISLLQEFDDVFLKNIISGLPPLKGIKHQIELVLGVATPN